MINKNFKTNWLDIISFNSKLNIIEDPKTLKQTVRIPLTPFRIDAYLLNYLLGYFYSEFINDQQNILDLILSDFDIENKVLGLYLSKTRRAGVVESVKSLPKDFIIIKENELSNIDILFNKIQSKIFDKYKLKISSIRFIKRRGIDLINRLSENLEKISTYEFLQELLDLIEKLIGQELFFIYPEPILTKFIKANFKVLDQIKISKLFEFLEDITPDFDNTLLINFNEMLATFQIKKYHYHPQISELEFNINRIEELKIPSDDDINKIIEIVKLKTKSKNLLYFDQTSVFSLLKNLIYLNIPLEKNELKLFLQKIIFGYRSFNFLWKMFPKPKIYNTLIRFLIRLVGININFRKLSHWAIPDLIFNLIDNYFGLNSNILLLISNNKGSNKEIGLLFKVENSSLIKIIPININSEMSLMDLKVKVSKDFGFISGIIKLDKALLKEFLSIFVFNYHKLNIFRLVRFSKMIKDPKLFQIYPELPPYKFLRSKSSIGLLKTLLLIFIDKHEF